MSFHKMSHSLIVLLSILSVAVSWDQNSEYGSGWHDYSSLSSTTWDEDYSTTIPPVSAVLHSTPAKWSSSSPISELPCESSTSPTPVDDTVISIITTTTTKISETDSITTTTDYQSVPLPTTETETETVSVTAVSIETTTSLSISELVRLVTTTSVTTVTPSPSPYCDFCKVAIQATELVYPYDVVTSTVYATTIDVYTRILPGGSSIVNSVTNPATPGCSPPSTWVEFGVVLTSPTTYLAYTAFEHEWIVPEPTLAGCGELVTANLTLPTTDWAALIYPTNTFVTTPTPVPSQLVDYIDSFPAVLSQLSGTPAVSCDSPDGTATPATSATQTVTTTTTIPGNTIEKHLATSETGSSSSSTGTSSTISSTTNTTTQASTASTSSTESTTAVNKRELEVRSAPSTTVSIASTRFVISPSSTVSISSANSAPSHLKVGAGLKVMSCAMVLFVGLLLIS